MEPGSADVDALGLDALFGQGLLESLEDGRIARCVLRAFGAEGLNPVLFQAQAAGFVHFELRQLQTARPEINRQK